MKQHKNLEELKTSGKLSKFVTGAWQSFIMTRERPETISVELWAVWQQGVTMPPYKTWTTWFDRMGFPFEKFLLHIATYTTNPQTLSEQSYERTMRSHTLRQLYGRIDARYYDVLDTLLNRKVVLPQPNTTLDIRANLKPLEALRQRKWEALLTTLPKRPVSFYNGLRRFYSDTLCKSILCGNTVPAIEKAGLVATFLGIDYEKMFAVYTFDELPGCNLYPDRVRRTMNSLRCRFNKSWPKEVLAKYASSIERNQRMASARRNYLTRRNEGLLKAFNDAVERSIKATNAGDNEAAGLAKVEARALEAQLTTLQIAHGHIEKTIEPISSPVMRLNAEGILAPTTSKAGAGLPKPVYEPLPPLPDKPVAYEVLPPPPPPPTPLPPLGDKPGIHDFLKRFPVNIRAVKAAPVEVEEPVTTPSTNAVLDL
ncbi:MAG: hypothetical protein WC869_00615 [Phycisphaerae bacterium]|jgi:hypothetical protein